MLAEPGFWLIVAGGLLVEGGFIGLVFSRLGHEVYPVLDQTADDPVKLPKWFSTDTLAEPRRSERTRRLLRSENSSGLLVP